MLHWIHGGQILDQETKRSIESAGAWFVGRYAERLYANYTRISTDPSYKSELIRRIFSESGRDSLQKGTATRVNAVLKIIRRKALFVALTYVADSRIANGDDAKYAVQAREFAGRLNSHS